MGYINKMATKIAGFLDTTVYYLLSETKEINLFKDLMDVTTFT